MLHYVVLIYDLCFFFIKKPSIQFEWKASDLMLNDFII